MDITLQNPETGEETYFNEFEVDEIRSVVETVLKVEDGDLDYLVNDLWAFGYDLDGEELEELAYHISDIWTILDR
jgi:hypothetical protein